MGGVSKWIGNFVCFLALPGSCCHCSAKVASANPLNLYIFELSDMLAMDCINSFRALS